MALQKAVIYKGIDIPEAYYKITRVMIEDTVSDNKKVWQVQLMVTPFTDATKSNALPERYHNIMISAEKDLNYPNYYSWLKGIAMFKMAVDILDDTPKEVEEIAIAEE